MNPLDPKHPLYGLLRAMSDAAEHLKTKGETFVAYAGALSALRDTMTDADLAEALEHMERLGDTPAAAMLKREQQQRREPKH